MANFIIGTYSDVYHNLLCYLAQLPSDKKFEVSIKPYKKSVTRNQRNYWHTLVRIIAEFRGISEEDMKADLKTEWLEPRRYEIEGKIKYRIPSTEEITRDEYSLLITKTYALGGILELKMPTPRFLGTEIQ